jgi:hypothetical protein
VRPGHLHVEEGDIGRVTGDFVERFNAVGRLADDLDAIELARAESTTRPAPAARRRRRPP